MTLTCGHTAIATPNCTYYAPPCPHGTSLSATVNVSDVSVVDAARNQYASVTFLLEGVELRNVTIAVQDVDVPFVKFAGSLNPKVNGLTITTHAANISAIAFVGMSLVQSTIDIRNMNIAASPPALDEQGVPAEFVNAFVTFQQMPSIANTTIVVRDGAINGINVATSVAAALSLIKFQGETGVAHVALDGLR